MSDALSTALVELSRQADRVIAAARRSVASFTDEDVPHLDDRQDECLRDLRMAISQFDAVYDHISRAKNAVKA
jgi:hypothetical protein